MSMFRGFILIKMYMFFLQSY